MIGKHSLASGVLLLTCFGALGAACTSVPVDPCSREGVEYRLGQTLSDFAKENRGDLNDIRKASQYLGGETVHGSMKIALAFDAIARLADGFMKDVVPEVREISEQCGTTKNIKEVFFDFLRDEGVDKRLIDSLDGIANMLDRESLN